MTFLETGVTDFNRMRAQFSAEDGYEGVTVAGVLVVARDSGAMLLAQRAFDPEDAPEVAETWEMPGGHLEPGEDAWAGAVREFTEEIGVELPEGEVVHGWRAGDQDQYQGFVYAVEEQFDVDPASADPMEVQNVAWVTPEGAATLDLRPEFAKLDLAALVAKVSGNEESTMTDDLSGVEEMTSTEPTLSMEDLATTPIMVHGVLAPEDTESGDQRGFNAGAMTRRPYRLPFSWQESAIQAHDGSVVIGSVDRLMRKDGLIHWEGSLMFTEDAGKFVDILAFFGKFGVSVDGDKGSLDMDKTEASGVVWFDAVRAAGLTAVAIPAFAEAYAALGPHPEMPAATDDALTASMVASGDLVTFDRGPGWVTDPKETKRIHDYWTKKGEVGYEKIGWGTNGDFTRCVKLVGEKIATNSPEKARYIKQTCAQWHHDALGYWPGDLGKPGNAPDTPENRKRAATHASVETADDGIDSLYEVLDSPEKLAAWAKRVKQMDNKDIGVSEDTESAWEAVLVSSVTGLHKPPLNYFHQHPDMLADVWALESGALVVEEPDALGFKRVWGFAAEWGVCHIGMDGRCVEPPFTNSDDYPEFHLGRTKTDEGYISTGVLTYGVGHRDADTILSESPEQAFFDNINNAWAAVRVGENERGIWFSGVVLPGVPEDHIVKIEASGQVSGEWKRGAMRACLTVNTPGYPVERASAVYDEQGNVMAMAASAFTSNQIVNGVEESPCSEIETPAKMMAALAAAHAVATMEELRDEFEEVN